MGGVQADFIYFFGIETSAVDKNNSKVCTSGKYLPIDIITSDQGNVTILVLVYIYIYVCEYVCMCVWQSSKLKI